MEDHKIQIVETLVVIAGYLITFYVTRIFINNTLKQAHLQRSRRKIIIKAVHLFSFIASVTLLFAVWGLDQKDITLFIGTILTTLGIAFFAQWSLLSNVTSSLLLFFNHPVKIGDTIKVMDKDCPFEGEVTDLTYFFVHLKAGNGEVIVVPNSLLLQKSICIIAHNPE
jgi:small-conductance mechanosensitive channel